MHTYTYTLEREREREREREVLRHTYTYTLIVSYRYWYTKRSYTMLSGTTSPPPRTHYRGTLRSPLLLEAFFWNALVCLCCKMHML